METCFLCHQEVKATGHNRVHVGGIGEAVACDRYLKGEENKMSHDWIPTAIQQKNGKLTLALVTTVPYVFTENNVVLATRQFTPLDIKKEEDKN